MKGSADPLDLIDGGRGFDKDDVRSCLLVKLSPAKGILESGNGNGIGTGDDQESVAAPGGDSRLQLSRHFRGFNQLLARRVSTLLGDHLILQLDGLGSRRLVFLHGPAHIGHSAEPRVGVGQNRDVDAADQVVQPLQHLGKGDQAGVGETQVRGGVPETGEVDGFKAAALHHFGGDHVVAGGDQQGLGKC